jgi:tetratricopeptide (TPR) repeat protein
MAFGGDNADSYYDEGLTASMKGDTVQAIRHFENAIKLDSTHAAAYHQIGRCYHRLGRTQKAADILSSVVKKRPGQIPPRLDLAYALLDLGHVEQAQRLFSEVASAKPEQHRAQLGLAYCAFQQGQWEAAMSLAQAAVTLGGSNFGAYYLLGRAARLADRPDIGSEALKKAEALIGRSIESSPDQPDGYYLRGEVYFTQENFSKALEDFRLAEERMKPEQYYSAFNEHFTRVEVLARQGVCLQKLGRVGEARQAGEAIVALDAEHALGKMLAGLA